MRAKCSMQGCMSATYNRIGYLLSFHKFPRNPKRQKIWKEICKNPKITNTFYKGLWLCSSHFERSCYANNMLKSDAIPTLNLPETTAGLFSYEQRNSETNSDTNDSNLKRTEHEKGVTTTTSLQEAEEKQTEGSSKDVVTTAPAEEKQQTDQENIEKTNQSTEEYDDCESVNFSSSEDEELENEPKQVDWETLLPDSHPDITHSTPGPSKVVPPKPAKPIHESLPVISKVSTIEVPDEQTLAISSVIDKAVEECFEEAEEDDCSTFAAHVKARMRRFDPAQKVIAQKLISDVMFMADTKQLRLASSIVNPQTAFNGVRKKAPHGSSSAYVIDSSDDDSPEVKKKK